MEVKIWDRSKFIEGMKAQLQVNPKTTALVAVDMHQGHLDPEFGSMLVPEDERRKVLTNARKLIELVRPHGIPIIHVIFQLRPVENQNDFNPFSTSARMVNAKLKPEEKSWVGKPRSKDGWWQPKIMPEIAPRPEDYIINNKKTYSIYLGTDLEHLLKTLKVDTVVLMGINTNTCALNGAFEAANRGFKLIYISDCLATAYGQDLHVFALQNVARCIGWVLTVSEFEEKLKKGIQGA